jgi:uncharacterized protein YlxP (DUF503 family)
LWVAALAATFRRGSCRALAPEDLFLIFIAQLSTMPVGLLTLEIHIPDAQSLKDKRQVLRSLKDQLRRQYNVAIAELDHHDVWQRSVIGIVTLSNEEKHVREMLNKVLDEADRILGSALINQNFEII